jgi:hypothetical protein
MAHPPPAPARASGIDLYWLPLGAGGRVVPRCGRAYERLSAARAHRPSQALFHSALELAVDGTRHVVEMAPVWSSSDPGRGVVVVGPVGLRPLGRLAAFRYEIRCWPGGRIPDAVWAVESPVRLTDDETVAARVLARVGGVPALTWGRDDLALGEMWNSNSVVAWLLSTGGLDPERLAPPRGGRAPGWSAGVALADGSRSERTG